MNLGKETKGTVYITEEARKAGLAIFGVKNTGKAYTMIPYLFEQDLEDKNTGITIVVDSPKLSWYLLAMAKLNKRKAELIKPSIDARVLNNLIYQKEWDYEKIKAIFDYEKAVADCKVVIIDMEQDKFGSEAIRATSMLLLQLQAIMTSDRPKTKKHSIYIDGAGDYLPYIKNLLKYGDSYNFFTTLFFKSRYHLEDTTLLDDYIRNFVLLQGITWEDAKYFGERFGIDTPYNTAIQLMDRDYGSFSYEILDKNFQRRVGSGTLVELPDVKKKEIKTQVNKLIKNKKSILKDSEINLQFEDEKDALKRDDIEPFYEQIDKKVPHEEIQEDLDEFESVVAKNATSENSEPIEVVEEAEIVEPVLDEEPVYDPEPELDDEPDIEPEIEPDIEVNMDEVEEEEPKIVEPQLNKKRKSVKFESKPKDLSSVSAIEITLDEPIEERKPEIIDLGPSKDDVILQKSKGKNLPYSRIINKKVKNSLDVLKW